MIGPIDVKDVFYAVLGLALLLLTLRPAFSKSWLFNLPLVYVAIGVLMALVGLPTIDPMRSDVEIKIVEHVSELIVIVSLAGAGLAIDTPASWKNWQPTWRLLMVTMPLTILAIVGLGLALLSLPLATAVLLAAALAPTDPVLAQSVAVGGPGEDEEPISLGLTAEAGLNDGLAFPFVWLAITLALLVTEGGSTGEELLGWFGFDVIYRIAVGIGVGWGLGKLVSRFAYSQHGDATQGAANAGPMILGATLAIYGVTEALDGYGFLAVFFGARAGRRNAAEEEGVVGGNLEESYEREVHDEATELESILLAVVLLWLGAYIGSGLWRDWTLADLGAALAIVFLVRPLAGWVGLLGYDADRRDKHRLAFFGIRGMGSVFYASYGQTHAEFVDMEAVWRVIALTILISVITHGFLAKRVMPDPQKVPPDEGPG